MKEFINSISPADVIETIKYIAMLILGAASVYYQSNSRLRELSGKYIATAQVLYTDNGARFEWVVAEIYKAVPVVLKPFVTKALVGKIVQSMFDGAKAYAKAAADKVVENLPDPMTGEE